MKTKFPDCYEKCEIVKVFGCGECESVCPHKFDKNGIPKQFIKDREKAIGYKR